MKARKKLYLVIGLALLVLVVYLIFVFPWSYTGMRIFLDYAIRHAYERRVLLLCKTDHQALLKAGREILSQEPVKERIENIKNRTEEGHRLAGYFFVPKGVRIPQAIRVLRPHLVAIDYYGFLLIEMHGGMDHFGVRIYPADFKVPYSGFEYTDRKLIEGLWYYDDGYGDNPDYDKWIDALVEKHKGK